MTWRSRVRFPAAAASTCMGDRLRTGEPPRYFTKPPRQRPKCDDALRLGSKGRMAHSTRG